MNLYDGPLLPLNIKPYIGNYKVSRTLIDSGSGINLLFANAYDNLGLPRKHLLPIKEPFCGIMSGMSAYPLERIDLQVPLEKVITLGLNSSYSRLQTLIWRITASWADHS